MEKNKENDFYNNMETELKKARISQKKSASYLHRTAQPHTLAIFRSWGSSVGAGRIRLAECKDKRSDFKWKILNGE